MMKYIKQLNIALAVIAVIIASLISANTTNAAISDWFYNKDEESTAGKTAFMSSLSSYISTADWTDEDAESADSLSIIQNSALTSVNSPASTKKSTEPKKTVATKLREMVIPASAYSSTPDQTDDSPFITAWNTRVRDGIVAANFLPFGTQIKIPEIYGDKIFIVEDRMNRRYWHKIDIWFPDRQSALEFGIRTIKIQILES